MLQILQPAARGGWQKVHNLGPLPGDLVWIRRRRWRVERVRRDRHVVRLDVAARDRRLTFLAPFDRAFTCAALPHPRRVRPQQALARLAGLVARAHDLRLPSAATGAQAAILPHQLEPALAILAGRPRVLIADEVGLGKTVQAGLVVAELIRRDAATRALVLTPAALREQWTAELDRRFGIACLAADRAGLDALAREGAFGDNPWDRCGVWIASPDFLKQAHVFDALPRDPWDLVVIDEAHTVCGDSDRYDLAHQLARRSWRVVLMTATPHGGDEARFARLIGLGQLDAECGGGGPEPPMPIFRRTRAVLGAHPVRRVRWHRVGLSADEACALEALRAFERAVMTRAKNNDQALLLLCVLRKRALSTMAALAQSLTRRLAWLGALGPDAALEWSQPRLQFEDESDAVDREEREGLTAHTGLGDRQERSWIRRLRTLAEAASRDESKVERLAALIDRTADPVVVFTEFRDSLDAVRRRLRFSRAVSILHGGQDAAERRQQLAQFLDGSTSVLLATDVAGQGLNLQSRARWVVSLELPWNPARLEQRIGRVDRIAQTRPTHFTLLIARDESESGLLAHLSRRILSARQSMGDDALAGVAPPEAAIRDALLQRADAPPKPRPAPAPVCRRWERLAKRAARVLLRQRALAAHWRAPDPASDGPIWAAHDRCSALIPAPHRSLFVYAVPMLDDTDAVVERRLVAIASPRSVPNARVCRTMAAALRAKAARAAHSRVTAAVARAKARLDTAAGREHALAMAIRAESMADEAQPGLFDLRDVRAFEARRDDAGRAQAGSARRLDRARAVALRAGEPVLAVVLSRRA